MPASVHCTHHFCFTANLEQRSVKGYTRALERILLKHGPSNQLWAAVGHNSVKAEVG
jgi:hypothetical protein